MGVPIRNIPKKVNPSLMPSKPTVPEPTTGKIAKPITKAPEKPVEPPKEKAKAKTPPAPKKPTKAVSEAPKPIPEVEVKPPPKPKTPEKPLEAPEVFEKVNIPKPPESPVKTPVDSFTDVKNGWKEEYPGQVSMKVFNDMTMTAQNQLWSELQKLAPEFDYIAVVLPSERSNKLEKRLKDAQAEGTAGKPFAGQLWCPYCASWRTFRNHNGYDRCIACSMSTMDFYTRSDNHLWSNDLDSKGKKMMKALNKRTSKAEDGEEE